MPARKSDAHRALELLEEYHSRLTGPDDKPLRTAIERIIRIFRSRLFQALVEIQDFYDTTLMDDIKASPSKTREALEMAARWEKQSPMPGGDRRGSRHISGSSAEPTSPGPISPGPVSPGANGDDAEQPPQRPPPPVEESFPTPPSVQAAIVIAAEQVQEVPEPEPLHAPVILPPPVDDSFEMTVTLTKVPGRGLGFSIAGGYDNQHVPGDNRVYITKIIAGGLAQEDGRLQADDCVLQVNNTVMHDVGHGDAVQALRQADKIVVLRVLRKKNTGVDSPDQGKSASPRPITPILPKSNFVTITLVKKDRGLGFSIAGGIGNRHVDNDDGIFITKLIPGGVAEIEGTLTAGDKLLQVNDTVLHRVTHADAVQALQRASGTTVIKVEKGVGPETPPNSPGISPGASPLKAYPTNSRRVTLQKGGSGLGFNIVGGEGGEGIYISYLLTGGVADLSGQLRKGDQILEVNNKDVSMASHEEAAQVLKGSGSTVSLLVAYRPDEYSRFESRINRIRETLPTTAAALPPRSPSRGSAMQYCRSLFDYDHGLDAGQPGTGLSFRHGDILHIFSTSDSDWWQARRVNPENCEDEGPLGYVPSKKRIEKKMRANKKKPLRGASTLDDRPAHEVSSSGSLKRKRSFTFSKKLPFFKKSEKDKKKDEMGEDPVLSYEEVILEEVSYKRPVVVLGPMKDRINDDLIQEFPEKFGSCVPHTTRGRRDYEVDGRDYHFVDSRAQMEQDIQNHLFIEAGQYNDNLYGTSVSAVKQVAVSEQKHCVLDVSGYAIRRLQVAGLHPIAVFLKPSSPDVIRDQNRRITEEQAQKTYERALKLGDEFAEYFTAIVQADSPDVMYNHVKRIIRQHGSTRIWVPRREK